MTEIVLDGLAKRYGEVVALDALDLTVADGEAVTVLGPSGSGKSTMLRLVAGLARPTSGRVLIGGVDVTGLAPGERDIAMVFQDSTTLPHLTVAENIGVGLRIRRRSRREVRRRVADVAELLGIAHLLERRPAQISGGERQRVSIGRALLREPHVFLMDEPLSSLDAPARLQLRQELARLHREVGTTVLHVTHDQGEALALGERVAVMNAGRLEQVAAPAEVYGRPATVFVATFVGSPRMNLLPGPGVLLGVRPDDLVLGSTPSGGLDLAGEVVAVESHGSHCYVEARLTGEHAGTTVTVRASAEVALRPGDPVVASAGPARVHRFDPLTQRAITPTGTTP